MHGSQRRTSIFMLCSLSVCQKSSQKSWVGVIPKDGWVRVGDWLRSNFWTECSQILTIVKFRGLGRAHPSLGMTQTFMEKNFFFYICTRIRVTFVFTPESHRGKSIFILWQKSSLMSWVCVIHLLVWHRRLWKKNKTIIFFYRCTRIRLTFLFTPGFTPENVHFHAVSVIKHSKHHASSETIIKYTQVSYVSNLLSRCHTKRRMGTSFGMTQTFHTFFIWKKFWFFLGGRLFFFFWKVGVIAKEGRARPLTPVLLLVWQTVSHFHAVFVIKPSKHYASSETIKYTQVRREGGRGSGGSKDWRGGQQSHPFIFTL